MKQEERQLLLKDLCARLPYGVHICYDNDKRKETRELGLGSLHDFMFNDATIKPYLRPMSSMTEEEKNKWVSLMGKEYREQYPYSAADTSYYEYFPTKESFDYLSLNHFDYRGLIEKGLALEAPEGMYK